MGSESKPGLDGEAEESGSEATAEAEVGGPGKKTRGIEESGFLLPPSSTPKFQLKGGSCPKRKGESSGRAASHKSRWQWWPLQRFFVPRGEKPGPMGQGSC